MAAAGYRALLKIRPDDPDVLNSLAWVLGVELNKLDEAIQLANRGIATHASDPHLLDTRGALLLKLNGWRRPAPTSKVLDLARVACLDAAQCSWDLAEVYAKLGQTALAREKITEACASMESSMFSREMNGENGVIAEVASVS